MKTVYRFKTLEHLQKFVSDLIKEEKSFEFIPDSGISSIHDYGFLEIFQDEIDLSNIESTTFHLSDGEVWSAFQKFGEHLSSEVSQSIYEQCYDLADVRDSIIKEIDHLYKLTSFENQVKMTEFILELAQKHNIKLRR